MASWGAKGKFAAVVDIGANLASLTTALDRLGAAWRVTDSPRVVRRARRVILPGVGSADSAMRRLRASGLDRILKRTGQPMLGICLGMQLLAEYSAEGGVECLGRLPARVERLDPGPGMPVPHMGWNRIRLRGASPLFDDIADGTHMYFVHGYAIPVNGVCLASCEYGDDFAAAMGRDRVYATQFHPERSGPAGARLLSNFLEAQ